MDYPKLNEENYYKKINKIYKKYKIERKKTFRETCFPKKYELQNPQEFVGQYINPKTKYKSLLIYHKIGSGKTCSLIQIGEQWKKRKNIIVVLPASLIDNFRNELRSKCGNNEYISNEEIELLKGLKIGSKEYNKIIDKSDEKINKYYKIYSYNKFISKLQNNKLKLIDQLLLIDEIHNLISEYGIYYDVIYNAIKKTSKDFIIVIASATPMFDKPYEIGLAMNLLKIPDEFPKSQKDFYDKYINIITKNDKVIYEMKNIDDFKQKIKGYISYFEGANPTTFPEIKIKYVKCEMSKLQEDLYEKITKSIYKNEDTTKMKDLSNDFFIGTRIVSNVVFPNEKISDNGLKSFTKNIITKSLKKYSPKIYEIMKKISRTSGKIYIYSSFRNYGGIDSLIAVLNAYGYLNYKKNDIGRRRYAILSGTESQKYRTKVKNIYNSPSNICGCDLKILVLSPAIKEGISFFGVRQIHILEPYWNLSRIYQIIGRGSRFCSHKDLPIKKRKLKVYIYLAISKKLKETVDEHIYNLALIKNNIIKEFEKAIIESSIDCFLNKKSSSNNYTCDL